METVTERLLHEERKMQNRDMSSPKAELEAVFAKQQSRQNYKAPKCYNCGKYGHIQRYPNSNDKGTETKGYRLYDQKRSKVFFSRDVQFNEQMHGVEESNDSHEGRHILIDSISNDKLVADDAAPEAQLRRSERDRRPPDHFGEWVNFVGSNPKEPFTVSEALGRSDKSKWVDAMEKEVQSLHDNNVWVLTELPEGRKAVGSKWVF
ncbi:hypothetical protein BSL78_19915 [Apostichopus japonicus]|uniref:Uncharacterized protein n=1 Tax=Stichopus japonicus TaxID=307972 RepID=A0A2G8K5E2_STIJA|nr:hypothetical protein BSL78_19915 [Apostichopus japonicus]